jgi:uncharacterized protein YggT (Ycf19 family)
MNAILFGIGNVVVYLLKFYVFVLFVLAILRMFRADENLPFFRFLSVLGDPPARALSRKFPKLLVRQGHQYFDLAPVVLMLMVGSLVVFLESVLVQLRLGG